MSAPKEEKPSLFGRMVGLVRDRWFLSAIGALALALLIWFLGPLIPGLGDDLMRTLFVATIFFAWLTANLLLDVRAARRNVDMIAKIAEASPDRARSAANSAAAEEVGTLREKLEEALTVLRKSQTKGSKKRQYLYELPWYILIGPPGSGKTTALNNSGLKFPLSGKFGKDPLKGVGGTRNCEWLFTEDAILLDTAGRYTTQDSNQSVDQRAWLGFLGLLKQFRPRQPINGVMVAIGLSDLAAMTPAQRTANARLVEERLAELQREFGLRLPVYVLLTKADLIAGFVEFFDDLDREERGKVWGTTFALKDSSEQTDMIAGFDAEFDALTARLNERLLERIQEERDPDRRARIFGFPMQFASLKPMLHEFLGEIFTPSRLKEVPLLRGVYFTSATQQGTPFDRLIGVMGNALGLKLPSFSGMGRAYFVTKLLREVIFEEASLVGANPKVERRNWLIRTGVLSGIAAAGALLIGAWTISYFNNSTLIANEQSAVADYRPLAEPLSRQSIVSDDNVTPLMPVLDRLRALPAGYDTSHTGTPVMRSFGLNQGRKLESQAVRAYRRALGYALLPKLVYGVETQLSTNLTNPEYREAFLPLYLVLGSEGPTNKATASANLVSVKANLAALWGARAYPTLAPEMARAQFARHLDALFEEPLEPMALDPALLDRARQLFANTPIPERAYGAIKNSPAARNLPEWRAVDHAGAAPTQVFMRTSGKLLSEGIPGFFTYQGFHEVLLPQVSGAVRQAAEDTSWVLGPQRAVQLDDPTARLLETQTIDRYSAEFIALWDQLLADVVVPKFNGSIELANALTILSGPGSPLRTFTLAVADETTMNRAPAPGAGDPTKGVTLPSAIGAAATQAANAANAISRLAGGGGTPQVPGAAIDAHFKALHDRVAGPPGQTPLDDLMKQLGVLATDPSAGPRLQLLAMSLPPPLGNVVGTAAGGSGSLDLAQKRRMVRDSYVAEVLPVCRLLDGRYPLVASSAVDAPLGDFQQMFRPGGTLDTFFTKNLAPYVDTAPYRNKRGNDNLGLTAAGLALFERSQRLRDRFFAGGGMTVEFTITVADLSDEATKVELEIDGQSLSYEKGSPLPKRMQWPAPNGSGAARLVLTRPNGQIAAIETRGPWAMFRLLDRGKIEGNLPDQFTVAFNVEGLPVLFKVVAASARNPLRDRNFGQLQCPAQL